METPDVDLMEVLRARAGRGLPLYVSVNARTPQASTVLQAAEGLAAKVAAETGTPVKLVACIDLS